ncbi:MAG: FecR domain-containing protein [Methyloceanibacter sp.]|uniref:FecR domain-containing protein n=1 Tax=Methyloceanibacter sp. TaxID=1965321 RepID=UPI003D6D47E0
MSPAQADKVGVAAAVNPDAFSSLSGTPDKQLNIGKSIFYNERINTTNSGLVQVLLVDGSTFTVGPNSDLTIDKFVYDPNKKTGQVVATFSKGAMRFVGGKISKNEGGVSVKTPAGALAIRGGMFQASVNGTKIKASFLYGVSLSFSGNNGVRKDVFQQGYTLDLSSGTPVVRPTTQDDVQFFAKAFSGGGTVFVGGQGNQPSGNNNQLSMVDTISLQDLISDATATQIDSTLQKEETNEVAPNEPTNTGDDNPPPGNTGNNPPPPDNTGNPPPPDDTGNPPPPPILVETRVLTAPGTFTAFRDTDDEYTTGNGGDQGVVGGDPNATVDDFTWTFSIVDGRLVGTVTGQTDSFPGDGEPVVVGSSPASVNFPASFPGTQCANGVCVVTDATITQDGETTNYIGQFVGKKGFFAYNVIAGHFDFEGEEPAQVIEDPSDRILAFGGTAHNFGTPSGKLYLFALTPDVRTMSPAPFSSAESMPAQGFIPGQTSVSPLMLLTKDSNPESRDVWLQTSFYIGDTSGEGGYDQQSFVNIALGGIESGGLVGARRGGAQVDLYPQYDGGYGCDGECIVNSNDYYIPQRGRETYAFTGDIASLASADGDHFLGTEDPNVVIGFDSTGSQNIGRDIPLDPESSSVENQSGSTYHVGVGLGSVQPGTQQGGTFQGYAAGMVESEVPTGGFTNVVASESLDDFSLSFDPVTNTLQAGITVYDVHNTDNATDGYNFAFGDDPQDPQNRSAYIDDQHYAAIESADGTSVIHQLNKNNEVLYQNAAATSYFVSGEQLNVTKYFPSVFGEPVNGIGQPFCEGCEFMKWGAWGSRVAFNNGDTGPHYIDNIHLGWWVAGTPTSVAELNDLWDKNASATYNGHVIGDVASKLNSDNWKTYIAAGDLTMNWNFAQRAGDLSITNFDGRGFRTEPGGLTQPSRDINKFAGSLTQFQGRSLTNLTGGAVGSFFKGPQSVAQGVGGNFNLKATDYKAGGIFIGSGIPGPGPN